MPRTFQKDFPVYSLPSNARNRYVICAPRRPRCTLVTLPEVTRQLCTTLVSRNALRSQHRDHDTKKRGKITGPGRIHVCDPSQRESDTRSQDGCIEPESWRGDRNLICIHVARGLADRFWLQNPALASKVLGLKTDDRRLTTALKSHPQKSSSTNTAQPNRAQS
jgi:hypothetical protein